MGIRAVGGKMPCWRGSHICTYPNNRLMESPQEEIMHVLIFMTQAHSAKMQEKAIQK